MSGHADFRNTDRLTLDTLLADPLTQMVMRSDNITAADVAHAFATARIGLSLGGEAGWPLPRCLACRPAASTPWIL